MSDDQVWLDRAVDLATANVARGGGPFGAVVVRDEVVIGEGANRVSADLDPTAHAEVVAIRAACLRVESFSLAGATLYASCEPCPLCLSASLWARVDAVVHAADSGAAARAGFDDENFRRLVRADTATEQWPLRLQHHPTARSEEPFDAWRAKPDHVAY
jgi:guanine deaminase